MTSGPTIDRTVCDPFWTRARALEREEMATLVIEAMENAAVEPDGDVLRVTVTVTMRPDQFETFQDIAGRLDQDY
jgi:hypothetical protein